MFEFQFIFKKFKKMQWINFIILIIVTVLSISNVFLIRNYIDIIIYGQGVNIGYYSILIGILAFSVVVMSGVQSFFWHRLRYGAINHMRHTLFAGSLSKSLRYFQGKSIGETVAKIMDDSSMIAQVAVTGKLMFYVNAFRMIIFLGVLVFLSKPLSIVVIMSMGLYYLFFNLINSSIRSSSKKEREAYSLVMSDIHEKFQGLEEIKINQKESYFSDKFEILLKKYDGSCKKVNAMEAIGTAISTYATGFIPSIILICGAYLIFKDLLTVGSFIAFNTFLSFLHEPISNLSDYNLGRQKGLSVEDRVKELLVPEMSQENKKKDLQANRIVFEHVSFEYVEKEPILKDFNYRMDVGDIVAITGESGVGKSTLIKLLLKTFEPQSGNIFMGEENIQNLSTNEIYQKISLMSQQPFMFSGSILENMTLGEVFSEEDIQKVLELTKLNLMVGKLTDGIHTLLNTDGVNISGGEKQRISLARTLLRKSDIIVLDEPTSAIDPVTEGEIIRNLKKYVEENNIILIIITHKMKILEICNHQIELKKIKLTSITDSSSQCPEKM